MSIMKRLKEKKERCQYITYKEQLVLEWFKVFGKHIDTIREMNKTAKTE